MICDDFKFDLMYAGSYTSLSSSLSHSVMITDKDHKHVKILSLAFQADTKPESQSTVFWNQAVNFHPKSRCSFINLSSSSGMALPGHPDARFAKYLPLNLNDGVQHSLTIFCNTRSVSCIQIDGSQHMKIVRPSNLCCPITFYLHPFESIQSLHVITRRTADIFMAQGPFLLVNKTSFKRSLVTATLQLTIVFFPGKNNNRSLPVLRPLCSA